MPDVHVLNMLGQTKGLTLLFATLCIVDLFGVFPVIALPRAIVECGWFGFPLALIVFGIQIYTAILLGRSWVIAESLFSNITTRTRSPYAALAELAFGPGVSKVVTFILGATIFGGGIPNFLIAAQNLQVIGLKLSGGELDFSYCYWMLIIGVVLCPLMMLGSPKDMKWLAVTSVLTVVAASFLTWKSLVDVKLSTPPVIPSPSWESVAIAYGILAFQFDIHPMVLTVQMDMKEKNKIGQAIFFAFLVSGGMFMVTSGLVYTRLGTAVNYNTLQGLPSSTSLYCAVLLVTLQICLSMVVGTTAFFQNIEQALSIEPRFGWKRCVVRSGVVLLGLAIAETVPRFDLVMGLVGGSLTGQLMFVFPPLIYIRLRALQTRRKVTELAGRAPTQPNYGALPVATHILADRAYTVGLGPRDADTFEDNLALHSSSRLLSNRARPFGLRGSAMQVMKRKRDGTWREWLAGLVAVEEVLEEGAMTPGEKALNLSLMGCGVVATLLSSFYTLKGTIEYGEFIPPCILNVTAASGFLPSL